MEIQLTEEQKKLTEEKARKVLEEKMSIKEALGMTPEECEWLYGVAYRFYKAGKLDEAYSFFDFLSKVDMADARFPMGMGACRYQKKEYREAILNYMQAYYLANPKDPSPWYYVADCYLKLQEKWPAAVTLTTFVMLSKNKPEQAQNRERAKKMLGALIQEFMLEEEKEKEKEAV